MSVRLRSRFAAYLTAARVARRRVCGARRPDALPDPDRVREEPARRPGRADQPGARARDLPDQHRQPAHERDRRDRRRRQRRAGGSSSPIDAPLFAAPGHDRARQLADRADAAAQAGEARPANTGLTCSSIASPTRSPQRRAAGKCRREPSRRGDHRARRRIDPGDRAPGRNRGRRDIGAMQVRAGRQRPLARGRVPDPTHRQPVGVRRSRRHLHTRGGAPIEVAKAGGVAVYVPNRFGARACRCACRPTPPHRAAPCASRTASVPTRVGRFWRNPASSFPEASSLPLKFSSERARTARDRGRVSRCSRGGARPAEVRRA